VARPSGSPQSGGRNASSSRSFDREQDHVVAETGGHELEAPELNHRGARNRRNKSGHLEKDGKSVKNKQDPYLARQLSVFSPRGVTPTRKTSACSLFQMVMQEKTQRFILVRAREGPMSSGGGVFVLSCNEVLGQG